MLMLVVVCIRGFLIVLLKCLKFCISIMFDLIIVEIFFGECSYNVVIGFEVLMMVFLFVVEMMQCGCVIIVIDEIIVWYYLVGVKSLLIVQGLQVEIIIMLFGEISKSFVGLEGVVSCLFDFNVDCNEIIIVLGGGVIGDFVGFVVVVIKCGINFIQILIILLFQVDSLVGGKMGINIGYGKNFVGVFY